MGFHKDLEFGRRYEELAASMVSSSPIEWSPNKAFKAWDFRTPTTTYEVKADRLAHRYGNAFIEFECSSLASGICSSEADMWIYFVIRGEELDAYCIPRLELLELCKGCVVKSGGDNYRSRGYIVPLIRLKKFLVSLPAPLVPTRRDNRTTAVPPEEHHRPSAPHSQPEPVVPRPEGSGSSPSAES